MTDNKGRLKLLRSSYWGVKLLEDNDGNFTSTISIDGAWPVEMFVKYLVDGEVLTKKEFIDRIGHQSLTLSHGNYGVSVSAKYDQSTKKTRYDVLGTVNGVGVSGGFVYDHQKNSLTVLREGNVGAQLIRGKKGIILGLPIGPAAIVRIGFATNEKGLFFNIDGQASAGFLLGELNAEASYKLELYDFRSISGGKKYYDGWVKAAADSVIDGDMSAEEALQMLRKVVFEPNAYDDFFKRLEQPRSEVDDKSDLLGLNDQKIGNTVVNGGSGSELSAMNLEFITTEPNEKAGSTLGGAEVGVRAPATTETESVTHQEKLDPRSPHYDMPLAVAELGKGYERMRQAEAPPPRYPFEHLPNGGSLMTNARRLGELRGVMTVPVVAKRRPTRSERMNALGAKYGAAMEVARGVGLEAAVQKEFVAHYIALSADQDVRERDQAWAQATKADPEIGQQNLERSLAMARYGLDFFGDPELYGFLDDSGLGNHPEMIRMFKRAGEAVDAAPSRPLPIPKPGWKMR